MTIANFFKPQQGFGGTINYNDLKNFLILGQNTLDSGAIRCLVLGTDTKGDAQLYIYDYREGLSTEGKEVTERMFLVDTKERGSKFMSASLITLAREFSQYYLITDELKIKAIDTSGRVRTSEVVQR